MPSLSSSCIARAEYLNGTLSLTFHSGRTYTLRGVPFELYLGLLESGSPGRFFNTYLKGRY
jgi:hypothetical protein